MQVFYEFLDLKFYIRQCIVENIAGLAQLVEHLICNHRCGYYARQRTTIFRSFLRFFITIIITIFLQNMAFF